MSRQGSILKLIHSTGLNLTVCIRSYGSSAPCSEGSPALISKLLLLLSIVLLINLGDEPPIGVGAVGAGSLIAHVTGIASEIVGIGSIVISMEGTIAAGFGFGRIIRTGIAPVIIKVAADIIRIDNDLIGCRLRAGHFGAGLVVSAVEAAGGGETGGPAGYILDGLIAKVDPLGAGLIIACKGAGRRGLGFMIGVAILSLGIEQTCAHAAGDGFDPAGSKLTGAALEVITAIGAGKLIDCILAAGGRTGHGGIIVSLCAQSLGLRAAANRAGSSLSSICGTGSSSNRIPVSVGVIANQNIRDIHHTAGGASLDLCATLCAGCSAQGGCGIIMAAGRLADRRRNNHEVFGKQLHGACVGSDRRIGSCVIVRIGGGNFISIVSGRQRTEFHS